MGPEFKGSHILYFLQSEDALRCAKASLIRGANRDQKQDESRRNSSRSTKQELLSQKNDVNKYTGSGYSNDDDATIYKNTNWNRPYK